MGKKTTTNFMCRCVENVKNNHLFKEKNLNRQSRNEIASHFQHILKANRAAPDENCLHFEYGTL